jgi:hypothetical protein
MPRSAASIISRATQIAKCPQYTVQALDFLNAILSDLCLKDDWTLARGEFNFVFNTNLTQVANGNIIISGPNYLPMDYLRASGSSGSEGWQKSSIWYLQGVPYPMIPVDLAEFDIQVQQAGMQSYPWLWATDMSVAAVSINTTGNLTIGSEAVAGLTATPAIGQSVAGTGVAPGSVVTAASGGACSLSLPATATVAGASLVFGTPGIGYAYPPPSGAYPVMLRYQRQMPDLTQAQVNAGAFPWFPDDAYLTEELAGRLMEITDDSRTIEFIGDSRQPGRAGRRLAEYQRMEGDKTSRAQSVQLDRRTFGRAFSTLPNTKKIGW